MLQNLKGSPRLAIAAAGVIAVLAAGGVAVFAKSGHAPAQPAGSSNPVTVGMTTELHSVTCPTTNFCLAVGSYSVDGSSDHQRTLVEEWNGSGWVVLSAPSPSFDAMLEGVACASSSRCVAVGSRASGVALTQRAFALRWNEGSLSTMNVPSPPGDTVLNGVACPLVQQCVAVGSSKRGELPFALSETWNGQRWSLSVAPSPPGSVDSWFNSVTCPLPSLCVAVGASSTSGDHDDPASNTLVESLHGSKWSVDVSPTPGAGNLGTLASVACTSPSTCTAVGNFSPTNNAYGDDTRVLIEVGDEGMWTTTNPGPQGTDQGALQSIACPSRDRCAAVGAAPLTLYGIVYPMLETWTNGGWSRSPSHLPGSTLESVTCPSVTSCLAVGERTGGARAFAVWWHPIP